MNFTANDRVNDGNVLAASVASAGRHELLPERTIGAVLAASTGEVRPAAGAMVGPVVMPTIDVQDPARVRFWSSPV
jgi:hypothetical protein